jgi:hypothetical protein
MFQKKKPKLSKHHRHMRSHAGKFPKNNLVTVRQDHHEAFHLLFRNAYPWEIVDILNKKWISPDYTLVCVKTEEYYANIRRINSTKNEVSSLCLVLSANSR